MEFIRFILKKRRKTLLALAALGAVAALSFYGVHGAAADSGRRQQELTLRAIRRAADECFAVEGHYPPNIDYLYENYHVRVDTDKYVVIYDIFAPDVRPSVMLVSRR